MGHYSLAVALFDYLPVLLSATALGLLARGIGRRTPSLKPLAWTAVALIAGGGLCKASWKLLIAWRQHDLPWLGDLLFVLLAPGFSLMAVCLMNARRAAPAASLALPHLLLWPALPMGAAAVLWQSAPDTRLWFFGLLAATTLANAAVIAQAIAAARALGLKTAVSVSFAASFLATLALAGLARLPATESSAWLQESLNLSAQAALAYGCWHLGRRLPPSTSGVTA